MKRNTSHNKQSKKNLVQKIYQIKNPMILAGKCK